jgi:anti-anti-sigma factor
MLGMVMTRLVAELVYENSSWALRLQGEDAQPLMVDPIIIQQQLSEAETQHLVINLSRAPRVDSTGLKFLLSLYQSCSSHGIQLILYNPSHHLERILQIMQLNRLFIIEHEDRE